MSIAEPEFSSATTKPSAVAPMPFHVNVLQEARKNEDYRHVLFTGARTQLVVMTIPLGGEIGLEAHPYVEQLLFIASGHGKAIVNGVETAIAAGSVFVVPPRARHNVVNTGPAPMHIYTVYAPANHIDGRVHSTKADADADKADAAFGLAVR